MYITVFLLALLVSAVKTEIPVTVLDFEDASELKNFTTEFSTIALSTKHYKSGSHCLLWESSTNKSSVIPRLTLSFATLLTKDKRVSTGFKVWMYREVARPSGNLTITFHKIVEGRKIIAGEQLFLSQSFQGWRAVWVSYNEMLIKKNKDVISMEISAQQPNLLDHGGVCIDLLCFVERVSADSRDAVTPYVPSSSIQPKYDDTDFWQQTYRWFLDSKHPPPLKAYVSRNSTWKSWKRSFEVIEKRIDDWYASDNQSSYDYSGNNLTNFRLARWNSLMKEAHKAHILYENLTFSNESQGQILGPPLFARSSEFGKGDLRKNTSHASLKLKFNYVINTILFPLVMEYKLRVQKKEINDAISNECKCLQSADETKRSSLERLGVFTQQLFDAFASKSVLLLNESGFGEGVFFTNSSNKLFKLKLCQTGSLCDDNCDTLKLSIGSLNRERLRRIFLVLRYIKDQGWAKGSGLGSLDHEMLESGSGYMQSVFLLRKQLATADVLNETLDTMKWYNDFGEIYASALHGHFDYDGTTADRMRTILMYRLFTVIMIPMTSFKDKVRDMYALKTWIENALTINRGLGDMIKPDYTGFHHQTFYASSYAPEAIHVAALTDYFLKDTCFHLSSASRQNVQSVLYTLSTVADIYSVPSSLSGRFPRYNNSVIVKTFPAFAYTTFYSKETTLDHNLLKAFFRLFNISNPFFREFLSRGTKQHATYLNSIGSLNIIQDVLNRKELIQNKESPNGHWTKNFAALSIHRRDEWTITVKGFNRWVWDFESSPNENVFGLFQSHGSMLIANSEEALLAHDVNAGWDWTRIPGTTTINLDLNRLKIKTSRNYNTRSLAGGTSFYGSRHGQEKPLKNGVFGMDFNNPRYTCETDPYLCDMQFAFKKSVFFFDELIVYLGSNITAQKIEPYCTQTTLFQDKLHSTERNIVLHNTDRNSMPSDSLYHYANWNGEKNVTFKDTKGNLYYVPNPQNSGLNIRTGIQKSKDPSGMIDTEGRYVTAWLQHNSSTEDTDSTKYNTDDHYEYAILVASKKSLVNTSKFVSYEVQQKNQEAHIVKLNRYPVSDSVTHAYVIFQKDRNLTGDGVIRTVSESCVVITESTSSNLFVALSVPGFDFVFDDSKKGRRPCSRNKLEKKKGRNDTYPRNSKELGLDDLFCSESEEKSISVHLAEHVSKLHLSKVLVNDKVIDAKLGYKYVRIEHMGSRTIIHFQGVVNGFTTEAHFIYDASTH